MCWKFKQSVVKNFTVNNRSSRPISAPLQPLTSRDEAI
jgi:hypothetical protein